jgi:hypothetical protein
MRRARRPSRDWRPVCPCLIAALALPACRTTLEPVRLGLAACSSWEILEKEYVICEAPLEHAAAERDCQLREGHLVAVESAEENDALAETVFALPSRNIWLGGTRNDDFVWSWPSGAIFWRGGKDGAAEDGAFAHWQPGEPNNSSSQGGEPEACLALTAEGIDWNDRSCELALAYACELD